MADIPPVPTSMQMLARINEALAESGLSEPKTVRDPLPLFRELLQDWYLCQELPAGEYTDEQAIASLLEQQTAVELQAALRGIFNEAMQLSNAHGTLSIWTRRELDQELRRLQSLVEQAQQQRAAGGY
ncbi:hypothetical protein [Venatoribacter cucullus]|uniref:hypothetical protein n=1 Tax=Venatoribacter cucullus TaxID=2661630 RepID=UPI00223FF098|nr:hypothetical protein [Venatoribacter cucullus]UZK02789.1 hypothetical protein GAY96_02170 [Venatoribacter cucullus]